LDDKYQKIAIERAREDMRNEFLKAAEAKKKEFELAEEQLKQAKERKEKEAIEVKVNIQFI
jgi:hypothetical protein